MRGESTEKWLQEVPDEGRRLKRLEPPYHVECANLKTIDNETFYGSSTCMPNFRTLAYWPFQGKRRHAKKDSQKPVAVRGHVNSAIVNQIIGRKALLGTTEEVALATVANAFRLEK